MELNVEITGNDMFTLHNNRGYQKGKVVEKIVCNAMEQLGMPFINYTEVKDQIKQGDYLVQVDDKLKDVEIKSVSGYGVDKLYVDVYYYNIQGNMVKQYKQYKSTGHSLGWLYTCEADWLIGYNCNSGYMYIIKNFKDLKRTLKYYVQLSCFADKVRAVNDIPQNTSKRINPYMNWYINNYDSNKKTLSITFDLTRESFRQFAVDYEIIKINLKVS